MKGWSEPDYSGLKDIEGTFTGLLDLDGPSGLFIAEGPQMIYFYGPDPHIRWWRHWFYRIRERLTGEPYPVIVLASGPVTMSIDSNEINDEETIITGSFTSAGKWTIRD